MLRISGPCVICSCCADIDFEVRRVIMFIGFAFLVNKISWEDVTNILNEYLRPDIPRGTQCAHTFIFGQRDGYCSD